MHATVHRGRGGLAVGLALVEARLGEGHFRLVHLGAAVDRVVVLCGLVVFADRLRVNETDYFRSRPSLALKRELLCERVD